MLKITGTVPPYQIVVGKDTGTLVDSTVVIRIPPQPLGQYKLSDEVGIAISHKPFWLHRLGVRLVLGWRWEDA